MLVNAWIGCLAILSVALFFFGILGSSTYQELPKSDVLRDTYFPEVFRDFAITVRTEINLRLVIHFCRSHFINGKD